MRRAVVYRYRPDGSGVLWVHKPHGGWRRIVFASLADFTRQIGVLGAATTTPLPVVLLVPQVVPEVAAGTPLVPRAGPVSPISAQAP